MSKFLFTHRGRTLFLLSLVLVTLCLNLLHSASFAANGINKQINFQGKVVNSNGTNVTDGSYTFIFKLYTVSSSGTAIWTESKSITVNNGIFRTALGDTTALPGSVDFNTDSIYLGINFNSDGEMSPRVQFTGVPYAFNADQVNGVTAASVSGQVTMKPILPGGLTVTSFGNTNGVTVTTSHGTSGNSGDISIQTGGTSSSGNSGNVSIDTGAAAGTAGTITIAGTNATGLTLGRSGQGITLPGFATNNNSVLVTGAAGALTAITSSTAGQCFVSNAAGNTPSWGSCGAGGGANFWQINSGVLSPGNQTLDLAFGSTATASAKIAWSLSGTLPTEKINGTTSNAALMAVNNGVGDLFTASAGATPKFVITNAGNIGIGTVAPVNPLEIVATGSIDQFAASRITTNHTTATAGSVYSSLFSTNLNHTSGTMNAAYTFFGQTFYGGTSGASPAVTSLNSGYFRNGINGTSPTGTITSANAIFADGLTGQAGGSPNVTITNNNGLNVGNQGPITGVAVTNATGISISAQSGAATNNIGLSVNGATGGSGSNINIYNVQQGTGLTTPGYNELSYNLQTINTTAGDKTNYAHYIYNSATRSAGSNNLTNIGLYVTSFGGQSNYAAIFDQGNVGIGSTTPGTALDVTGTGRFSTGLTLTGGPITLGGVTGSSQCITGGATAAWGSCGTNFWQLNSGVLSPGNQTLDLAFGGTSTASAKFALSLSGTLPTAQVSGTTSFAALGINQSGVGDILAASTSGVTKFVIKSDGTASSAAGFTIDGLGNISSTKGQLLTLGGGGTGGIALTPGGIAPVQVTSGATAGNGVNITATSLNTGSALNIGLGASVTNATGVGLNITGATLTPGNGTTGNIVNLSFTGKPPATGGQSNTINGINLATTFSNANGNTTINAINIVKPVTAACSGTCAWNGISISTDWDTNLDGNGILVNMTTAAGAGRTIRGLQVLGTSAAVVGAQYGVDITNEATQTGGTSAGLNITGSNSNAAGTQYGININNLTAGASTEYALNIGTGWDRGISLASNFITTASSLVGLGTTAPLTNLHVTGVSSGGRAAMIVDQNAAGSLNDIIAASSSGTTKFVIKNDGTASSSAGFTIDGLGNISATKRQTLTIGNSAANNSTGNTLINSNGQGLVGIGTTVPRGGLDIGTAGALSKPAVYLTGTWLTDGSGTTVNHQPQFLIQDSSAVGDGFWNVNGTAFGIGSKNGFTGDFITLNNNANLRFKIDYAGSIYTVTNGAFITDTTLNFNDTGSSTVSYMTLDSTNGRLGLGTTAPASILEVKGTNGKGNALAIFNQTQVAATADILTASAAGTTRFTIASDGTIKGLNTSIYNCSGLGNSGKLTVDASGVVGCAADQGGAGGSSNNFWQINNGVLSPGNQTLDLAFGGTATSGAKIAWSLAGTNATQTITGSTSYAADVIIQNGVGDLLTASTGANTQFVVKNSGLTYIGGDKASNAEFSFDPSSSTLTLGLNGSATSGLTFYSSSSGNYGTISTDSSGNLNISTTGTGSVVVGKGTGNINLSLTGQDSDVFIADKTRSVGAAYALSDFTFKRALTGAGNNLSGSVLYVTDISSVTSGLNTADLVQVNAAPTAGVFLGNLLRLQKNGNDLMVVDRNGYVGIGTTTPAAYLHLSGSTFGTGNALAIFNQTNSSGDILTASVSGTTKFVITGGGNVGIGTTLPTAGFALDVVGSGRFSTGVTLASGQSYTGAGAVTVSSGGSGDLTFNSASTNVLVSSGNQLGIGTTNPAGTIDVRAQNGTEAIASISGRTTFAGLTVDNSGTGDLLTASSSGLNRFVIRQNGSVGIGTTLPTEKLQVVGGNIKIDAQTNAITALARISQTQPGKIASGGSSTELIASVSASAVYNGSLYVGTGKGGAGVAGSAEIYRYNPTTSAWTVLNSTAGTLNTTASIASISAMTVFNGQLYVGTYKTGGAEVYRYDGGAPGTWTLVSAPTAGTILGGGTASIDGVTAMAVYGGKLYIGTTKGDATGVGQAEVYRYEGSGKWTKVTTTTGTIGAATTAGTVGVVSMTVYNGTLVIGTKRAASAAVFAYNGVPNAAAFTVISPISGTFCASGAIGVSSIPSLTVYNGSLYAGTQTTSGAQVCRYDGRGSLDTNVATIVTWTSVVAGNGTIRNGGTASIQAIRSMTVYNGRLYIGTEKAGAAEIYQFIDGADWIVLNSTAGTFVSGGTSTIDSVSTLIQYNSTLYAGTSVVSAQPAANKAAEIYSYSNITDQSYALKFHASSLWNNTEVSGVPNDASIWFMASPSAQLTTGNNANTGSFMFSHGLITGAGAYDVAEDYGIRDTSATPGDLISIDENETGFVKKSAGPYDTHIVGVYSENPGFRLSQQDANINGAPTIPVALVGRVMVKVSTENGAIHSGDYLTSSSIAGVAMKATKSGSVVGKAMGEYTDQGIGKLLVYVTSSTTNGQSLDSLLPDGLNGRDQFGTQLLAELQSHISTTEGALSDIYADRIAAGLEIVTPKLTAGVVDASSLNITGNATISGTLTVNRLHVNQLDGLDILLSQESPFSSSESALLTNLSSQVQEMSKTLNKLKNVDLLSTVSLDSSSSAITTVKDGFMVFGTTTLAEASILNTLSVGTTLHISENSINTLGVPFEIQPMRQADISLMGGSIVISTDGTLHVNENAEFAKDVSVAGVLSATAIRGINDNLSVSGSATFDKIQFANPDIKIISNAEVAASASAGIVTLKSNQNHVKINNTKVGANSLLFITPKTNTRGKQLFIKEQKNGEYFTVGIDEVATFDIDFNFLIVN